MKYYMLGQKKKGDKTKRKHDKYSIDNMMKKKKQIYQKLQ